MKLPRIMSNEGYDVDRFMDPVQPDKTDAIYIKGPNLLIPSSVPSGCT